MIHLELFEAWIAFPFVLAVLCSGCGLLVEYLFGRRLPGALVPVTGLAALIVAGASAVFAGASGGLIVAALSGMALAGLATGRGTVVSRLRGGGWALGLAVATFAVFAAPIVLSGETTFAGYIKLDDPATWLALTDAVMEGAGDVDRLAPSTYEATLALNFGNGYPVGSLVPLGAGAELVGEDPVWVLQPYMAFAASLLALSLWQLGRALTQAPALRAAVAWLAAQPALLFGYYLWGGVKEIVAASVIAAGCALAAEMLRRGLALGPLAAFGLLTAALALTLSVGGVLWVVPALAVCLLSARRVVCRVGIGAAVIAAMVAGITAIGGSFAFAKAGGLVRPDDLGNLSGPLDPLQVIGIWPTGDFRSGPVSVFATSILIGGALVAAAIGAAAGARRRVLDPLLFAGSALIACFVVVAFASPWVDGKALAITSPAAVLLAGIGAALLLRSGWRALGGVLLAALAGGILWSNALAYRDVSLAPRDQLAELEEIGEAVAGRGPTLMTEYQPYGARHFLRDAEPEGVSELRRREVPLRGGGTVAKGDSVDTDDLAMDGLLVYRTLVLRRSPTRSRPPSPYEATWRGDYYEVWQRPARVPQRLVHLGLGNATTPVAEPPCGRVLRLAAMVPGGSLVAARAAPPIVVPLATARYPAAWHGSPAHPTPGSPGEVRALLRAPRSARYELWLGGSVRPLAQIAVDGRTVGEVRHQLQNSGQYTLLARARLSRGRHALRIEFHGADLHPGSGGAATPIGPLAVSRADSPAARLRTFDPAEASRLCGQRWDWIEAVSG